MDVLLSCSSETDPDCVVIAVTVLPAGLPVKLGDSLAENVLASIVGDDGAHVFHGVCACHGMLAGMLHTVSRISFMLVSYAAYFLNASGHRLNMWSCASSSNMIVS